MAPVEGIGARGIDQGELAEQLHRRRDPLADGIDLFAAVGLAPDQKVDLGGGRGHPFFEETTPEQGVDHRRLAGVELADDDDEKELIELTDGVGQGAAVAGVDLTALEHRGDLGQEGALVADEILLLRSQNCVQHYLECSALSRAHFEFSVLSFEFSVTSHPVQKSKRRPVAMN